MRYNDFIRLADESENMEYRNNTPSRFLHRYTQKRDIEISAVISGWLYFGEKELYMWSIDDILTNIMNNKPYSYIMSSKWSVYKDDYSCLQYCITWHNFNMLCDKLYNIYLQFNDLESAMLNAFGNKRRRCTYYYQALSSILSGETMIQNRYSQGAHKRTNTILRWLIRQNSIVDMGIWTNCKTDDLFVSIDYELVKSAKKVMKQVTNVNESLDNVKRLTDFGKKVFIDDPSRMDFALNTLCVQRLAKKAENELKQLQQSKKNIE